MASIFTKIIKGEIPCHKIYEDGEHLAFLDVRPIKPGHCLVVPKKEVDYIFDLEDDELSKLMLAAKKVAKALSQEIECERIGVTVIGLEVPHTHVHLCPINQVGDLSFANAKNAEPEELSVLASKIRRHL